MAEDVYDQLIVDALDFFGDQTVVRGRPGKRRRETTPCEGGDAYEDSAECDAQVSDEDCEVGEAGEVGDSHEVGVELFPGIKLSDRTQKKKKRKKKKKIDNERKELLRRQEVIT